MKVYLADLAHTYSVDDRSLPVPLGIGYIKAYAVERFGDGVDIRLFKRPEKLLAALSEEPAPDVIGFANYGWNENLNKAVGQFARDRCPDALIVAGGPNIDPEAPRRIAFLEQHDYIDYLVIDGGEEPFAELLEWHRTGADDAAALPGNLVWLEHGSLHSTDERPLKKIIDNIPSPYLRGYLDEFLAAGMIPMFETNRGCPFKCTFCAWGSASKDLVRRLDVDQALAEIAYVGSRSNARNWIVCDANFGILKRDVELAKAIRAVRDTFGKPEKCHIWLAKNVTERNLEIGEILDDMTVPVMAVQSLNDGVLEAIKRDNISTDTYAEYQQKFHQMGSRTYSDLIVPLPRETLDSHLASLAQLIDLGVDIVLSHNMRLLAGAETNSAETRSTYGFRTRFRLIHGDAGIYRTPSGEEIRVFEYEESLRETSSMSEDDLFYLRKLHFLVDFFWNIEVYKPLLKLLQSYGTNPITILQALLERAVDEEHLKTRAFFAHFDEMSEKEWFDSREDIERYFAEDANFKRLIGQEFEKLNVMFSVVLLRDAKQAFDELLLETVRTLSQMDADLLSTAAEFTFARFPPLSESRETIRIELPKDTLSDRDAEILGLSGHGGSGEVRLGETARRREVRTILSEATGKTLSKILNTQGVALRDLQFAPDAR